MPGNGLYGSWVEAGAWTNKDQGSKAELNVFGGYAKEYDRYRPDYPQAMWDDVVTYFKDQEKVTAIDIASGTGRGAIKLMGLNYVTIANDADSKMLEVTKAHAKRMEYKDFSTCVAPAEDLGPKVKDSIIDLIVCLQAFHWFDAEKALAEFYRIVNKERGIALVAWNDRDLTDPFLNELEGLFEKYNPKYNRYLKIAEKLTSNGEIFTMGNKFDLLHVRMYENPVKEMSIQDTIELCWTFSYVKNAIGSRNSEKGKSFNRDLTQLCEKYYKKMNDATQMYTFKWVCKLYILKPKIQSN